MDKNLKEIKGETQRGTIRDRIFKDADMNKYQRNPPKLKQHKKERSKVEEDFYSIYGTYPSCEMLRQYKNN